MLSDLDGKGKLRHRNSNIITEIPYHSLGVRLVASTYSPHRQASPPRTSCFCSWEPTLKSLHRCKLSGCIQAYIQRRNWFLLLSLSQGNTFLLQLAGPWQVFAAVALYSHPSPVVHAVLFSMCLYESCCQKLLVTSHFFSPVNSEPGNKSWNTKDYHCCL